MYVSQPPAGTPIADGSAGPLPASLFTLSNLTTVDIEYTRLTGPVANMTLSSAPSLQTLMLVNNGGLGNTMPILSANGKLTTLSVPILD